MLLSGLRCPVCALPTVRLRCTQTAVHQIALLHLPPAAQGNLGQILTGFASSKGISNKKSADPVGSTDFLELLARFELATVLPQSLLCGSPTTSGLKFAFGKSG